MENMKSNDTNMNNHKKFLLHIICNIHSTYFILILFVMRNVFHKTCHLIEKRSYFALNNMSTKQERIYSTNEIMLLIHRNLLRTSKSQQRNYFELARLVHSSPHNRYH